MTRIKRNTTIVTVRISTEVVDRMDKQIAKDPAHTKDRTQFVELALLRYFDIEVKA